MEAFLAVSFVAVMTCFKCVSLTYLKNRTKN